MSGAQHSGCNPVHEPPCSTCGEAPVDCRGTYDGRYCDGRCVYCKEYHDEYEPCHVMCDEHGGDCTEPDLCIPCLLDSVHASVELLRWQESDRPGDRSSAAPWKRWDQITRRYRDVFEANRERNHAR